MDTSNPQRNVGIRKYSLRDVTLGHPIEIGSLIMLAVDGVRGSEGSIGHGTEPIGPGHVNVTIRVVVETTAFAPNESGPPPGAATLPS